ncbi:MAG: ABC transporter substrate-binding protein, partial [Gluconacetobacter diazotrophicus]|nr:ABC transporter substrate-binding protein [Gluconacetobacter diazotrophicus]
MERDERSPTRRRLLVGGAAGLVAAGTAGLVVRNQIRHPHRDKRSRPDGRYRRVALASPHPMHDAELMAARNGGIFARYNLDVSIVPGLNSGAEALEQLKAGHAEAAVAPALSWLPRLIGGLDARLISGLQSGSSRLLIDRKSRIKRIEDLFHGAVGIADNGADRLFFSIMMRRKGMNPENDVRWVQIPPDRFGDALGRREVQAVAGHDPVIWQIKERFHLPELASSMTGSYGTRVSRVLGLRGDVLRDDPGAAVVLTLAMQDAAAFVQTHPADAASLMADDLPDMTASDVERMFRSEGHAVHPVG